MLSRGLQLSERLRLQQLRKQGRALQLGRALLLGEMQAERDLPLIRRKKPGFVMCDMFRLFWLVF